MSISWRLRRRSWTTWSGSKTATAGRSGGAGPRPSIVYVGLGSNLGDRESHLAEALRSLSALGTVDAISSVWRTEPVGYADQPEFWNVVVRLLTNVPPRALLESLQRIERRLGRERSFRDAPRPIDLDILFYDDLQLSTERLIVPHPRVLERGFTLRPLLELDPTLLHPGTGRSVAEHLADADALESGERLFAGERLDRRRGGTSEGSERETSAGDDAPRSGA